MDFNTPVGRLVQGSVQMQQQKDMDTNQPLLNPDGTPQMGVFMGVAFPKVLPNGQPNTEFEQFWAQINAVAAAAWPTLFPNGRCINPRFSWKFQDGDGVDQSGKSVADKPGFKGNYVIKFYTSYPVRCFNEGKFGAHEEIQNPQEVIKRGYWIRLFGEAKGNNASGTQVPGISLYPKLLSYVERGDEILSGPDASAAFGGAPVGWRPPASASPVGMPGAMPTPPAVGLPTPPAIQMPSMMPMPGAPGVSMMPGTMPAGPQYTLSAALQSQGITIDALIKQGWTHDALVAQGHATRTG